jgi:hypothetical protein
MRRILEVFGSEISVINLGLAGFSESLVQQGVEVVQVDWRPPAGGDRELLEILDELEE